MAKETKEVAVEVTEKKPAKAKESKCYPKYKGNSSDIDEVFCEIGVPAEYRGNILTRSAVANANGIAIYLSTLMQNAALIELAKAGTLVKP